MEFGKEIVALRDKLVYTGGPFDVVAMRAMREKQLRQLVRAGTTNAKLSPGHLADTEYLVQGLQITYGHLDPALRSVNTLEGWRPSNGTPWFCRTMRPACERPMFSSAT